jgi:hypothetical protein
MESPEPSLTVSTLKGMAKQALHISNTRKIFNFDIKSPAPQFRKLLVLKGNE